MIHTETSEMLGEIQPKRRSKVLSSDWEKMLQHIVEDQIRGSKQYFDKFLVSSFQENKQFCTGSSYTGHWNNLGMNGDGTYTYHSGCKYEGEFEDGRFHGKGVLKYPMGQKLEGIWDKGKLVSYKFSHEDSLDYNDNNWPYCKMPDRRFNISFQKGLQPAGREFMTNCPERPLYPRLYDTGDGYYNSDTRSVFAARDPVIPNFDFSDLELEESKEASQNSEDYLNQYEEWINSVTMVSEDRHNWITNNCRKGWDHPAGYRPDLYEFWVSGRRKELEELEKQFAPPSSVEENLENNSGKESPISGKQLLTLVNETRPYGGTGRKLSMDKNEEKYKYRNVD